MNQEIKETAVDLREANGPIVETQISKSKDGKWIIHKTIITDIKSVNYYGQILKRE